MKVYLIIEDPLNIKSIALDVMDLALQLGDPKLNRVFRANGLTNEPLFGIWSDNITSTMNDVIGTNSQIPDISLWDGPCLLLSENAFHALKGELHSYGEFLPLTVDGKPMYIFNCLTFGQEDESLCVKEMLDGYVVGLERLVFDSSDIESKLVFKSKLGGGSSLFVTDTFKKLCKKNNLQGLIFREDLLDHYI